MRNSSTPSAHVSTATPEYFLSCTISGAAYAGVPAQDVTLCDCGKARPHTTLQAQPVPRPHELADAEVDYFDDEAAAAGTEAGGGDNEDVVELDVSGERGRVRAWNMSYVTRHTSHVTRRTSHVTRHTSHVTRHTSHVTRHL